MNDNEPKTGAETRPLEALVIPPEREGDWVKIVVRKGLYYTTMDCANHPLNDKKSKMNLNAPATFWRWHNYPFWVNSRDFAKKPYELQADVENFDSFVELIGTGTKEDYLALCDLWDYCRHDDMREKLLTLSKAV